MRYNCMCSCMFGHTYQQRFLTIEALVASEWGGKLSGFSRQP